MTSSPLHALLLLSDSALPLGSFAFSSGLESYLNHTKLNTNERIQAFQYFLYDSLENLASTALPFVLAAYNNVDLIRLDDEFDAITTCTVAKRASIAQGRALLQIWERALKHSTQEEAVSAFFQCLKDSKPDALGLQHNGHIAPLFGAVCKALQVSFNDTAYLFLLNHAKAVLSAAVRASVMGPYQSQAILASQRLQDKLNIIITQYSQLATRDAAVTVPVMDLWMGRHELLYSRIFNS